MKNKKNQKINIKKILLIAIPLFILILSISLGIYFTKKNNENGVFSILEKRWIEKNKSTVIDVSILNDVPIFGNEGKGVFFDFLNDFSKETNLEFNMIPYSADKTSENNKYIFEINNKTKLDDNELLFFKDNYVLISKDSKKVKKFTNLEDVTIGALDNELTTIKDYLSDNTKVVYNTYTSIDNIVQALNNNEIKYAIIPSNIYIDKIFSNNYYVFYNIPEIYTNYVLKVDGDEKILNSIINKFYIRWKNDKLSESYNNRLFELYFDKKNMDDVTRTNFMSKEYVYGYVRNLPYESKINEDFIVTGYDGSKIIRTIEPDLPTVVQPIDQIADELIKTLMAKIKDPQAVIEPEQLPVSFHYPE